MGCEELLVPGNAHRGFCSSPSGLMPSAKQAMKIKQIRRLKLFLGHAQPMKLKKRSLNRISEVRTQPYNGVKVCSSLLIPPIPLFGPFITPNYIKNSVEGGGFEL
jgi:hypothetical protein